MTGYNYYLALSLVAVFSFTNTVLGCTYLTAYTSGNSLYSHSAYNGYTNYYSYTYTCWRITASTSTEIVKLYVNNFELEYQSSCSYDYFRMYDGYSTSSNYVTKCGDNTWTTIYSSGMYLYLVFSTDATFTDNGFHITYSQVSSSYYDSSDWYDTINVGAIIGIVIGCIIALVVIVIIVVVVCVVACSAMQKRGRVIQPMPRHTGTIIMTGQQMNSGATPSYITTHGLQPGVMAPNGYNNYGVQNQPPPPYAQSSMSVPGAVPGAGAGAVPSAFPSKPNTQSAALYPPAAQYPPAAPYAPAAPYPPVN